MTTPFSFSTTFVLDKRHFIETYDETNTARKSYVKAMGLTALGLAVLLLTDISGYIAWFVIALGGLEALSVRFHKPWWLTRQMFSRAANEEVTLTIDEEGVATHSAINHSKLLWSAISKLERTAQGWLLYHANGRYYLSSQCLSAQANHFLSCKAMEYSE